MKPDDFLKQMVKAAVKHTLVSIEANHPGESLDGYAIVTDDELRTLGHLASTDKLTAFAPESRFEGMDWTYDDGFAAFDRARELLLAGADAASATDEAFSAHVDSCFAALQEALRELKAEGLFDDTVFLTVLSTDPNQHLARLEDGAVRALNTPELYRRWRAFVAGQ